jgi:hypothetical protein
MATQDGKWIRGASVGFAAGVWLSIILSYYLSEPRVRNETATLACNQHGYPTGEIDDQWRIVCWHDVQKTVLGAK